MTYRRIFNTFLLSLACGTVMACRASSPSNTVLLPTFPPGATENEIFDATRTTPVKLLRDMYESHQFLVLGFTSHGQETQYQLLDSLLQQIGHDPRLKLIVLERPIENAPLLEEASTHEITQEELTTRFPTEKSAKASLCLSNEWTYTWSVFMPRIRALNAQRPAKDKLHVTTIDAWTFVPPDANELNSAEGEYRETGTSANFKRLWHTLAPTDKVILVYNIGHVIKTFTLFNSGFNPFRQLGFGQPLPVNDTVPNGSLARIPSNWMSTFLRDNPTAESQISVVMLDEKFWSAQYDTANLKFTQRQAARYPTQSFGVPLAPFRDVLKKETGSSVFTDHPINDFTAPYGFGSYSSSSLSAMIDGVIRLPDTKQWTLRKEQYKYLPEFCKGIDRQ